MRIDGTAYRTIFPDPDQDGAVRIIDQTRLPWAFETVRLTTLADAAHAIRAMLVRGAPLIGATAAARLFHDQSDGLRPDRRGPAHATGEQRSLKIGSVSTTAPASVRSIVA